MPVISANDSDKLYISSKAPCAVFAGWYGWSDVNPFNDAISSSIFGLYFIVQEPSG